MIYDIEIIETGNGGDAVLVVGQIIPSNQVNATANGYVKSASGWQNMIYFALFGGNIAQDTSERADGEQAFDWWGNSLFFPNEKDKQFNSQTERALKNNPITSSGRQNIEQAVIKDLDFMKVLATVTVTTKIVAPDRLRTEIKVVKLGQLSEQLYTYLWDGVSQQLTIS